VRGDAALTVLMVTFKGFLKVAGFDTNETDLAFMLDVQMVGYNLKRLMGIGLEMLYRIFFDHFDFVNLSTSLLDVEIEFGFTFVR
jgi:hypothetical protein